MIRTMRGWTARAVLALAAVTAAGCAGQGWEDVMNGGRYGGSEVRGEVRDVDSRSIAVRTEHGRSERVRYDSRTSVSYGGRRYSPRSLERGDLVVMRVSRDSRGGLYTRSIAVRRSASAGRGGVYDRRTGDRDRVRDRRDRDERYDTHARSSLEGRVERVDRRNGRFQLRNGDRSIWVSVARGARGEVREEFARLREGQRVRVQGRFLSGNRFEVEGFR
jgi:hypothetical protein